MASAGTALGPQRQGWRIEPVLQRAVGRRLAADPAELVGPVVEPADLVERQLRAAGGQDVDRTDGVWQGHAAL